MMWRNAARMCFAWGIVLGCWLGLSDANHLWILLPGFLIAVGADGWKED